MPENNNPTSLTNPVKAIRAFCLDCCGGNPNYVKDCTALRCALYPFRMGRNPYRTKRELTEEQKEMLRVRLANARKSV